MQDPANTSRGQDSSDSPGADGAPETDAPGGVVNQPTSSSSVSTQPLDAGDSSSHSVTGGVINRSRSSSTNVRVIEPVTIRIEGHRSLLVQQLNMDEENPGERMPEDLSPPRQREAGASPQPHPSSSSGPPPQPQQAEAAALPVDQVAPRHEEVYRASWVNFQSEICYGFARLYETKDLADVTIACEGHLIKCHKLVLSLSSKYFREMFESVRCKHPVIILTGIHLKDITNVLRFVYYGYFHGTEQDIYKFRSTADCLHIDGVYADDRPPTSSEGGSSAGHYSRPQRIVIEEAGITVREASQTQNPVRMPPIVIDPTVSTSRRSATAQFPTFPQQGRDSSTHQPRSGSGSASAQSPPSDFPNKRRRSGHFSPDDPRFDDSPPPGIRATLCEDSSSLSQDFGEPQPPRPVRRSVILRSPSSSESRSRSAILDENVTSLQGQVESLTVETSPRSSSQGNNIYIRRTDGEVVIIPSNRFSHLSPPGASSRIGHPPVSSPASDSRLSGPSSRPPVVVSHRRRAASDPQDDDGERYDLNLRNAPYFIPRGQRSPNLPTGSSGRGSSQHRGGLHPTWDLNLPFTATSESLTSDSSRHQLAMMHLEHAQRAASLPQSAISGATSQSRLPYGRGPMETIPLHLINPALMASRQNTLGVSTGHGSRGPSPNRPLENTSNRTNPGVIAISPMRHLGGPGGPSQDPLPPPPLEHPRPSAASLLDLFRTQAASGFYPQGHRSDRQSSSSSQPGPSSGGQSSHRPQQRPPGFSGHPRLQLQQFQIPNAAAQGGRQGMPPGDGQQPGPSRHMHGRQHQSRSGARPKTKAIRSSQVPQSARYTAQEVDMMVEQVANYPGNLVPCAVCQKQVKRERLRAHIHECHLLHGKRIICPHCGIGLKSKGSFRVHIWRHKRGSLPGSKPPPLPNARCSSEAVPPGSQQEQELHDDQNLRDLHGLQFEQVQQQVEADEPLENMNLILRPYDPTIDVTDDSDLDDEEYPNGDPED